MPAPAQPLVSAPARILPTSLSRSRLDKRGSLETAPASFADDSASLDNDASGDITLIVRSDARLGSLYERQHPERIAAHRAVKAALEAGRLAKPIFCPRCFRRKPVEAHHDDYRKPLKVRWLCRACHTHVHYKTQKNAPKKTWRWEMQATADDMAAAMSRARS